MTAACPTSRAALKRAIWTSSESCVGDLDIRSSFCHRSVRPSERSPLRVSACGVVETVENRLQGPYTELITELMDRSPCDLDMSRIWPRVQASERISGTAMFWPCATVE